MSCDSSRTRAANASASRASGSARRIRGTTVLSIAAQLPDGTTTGTEPISARTVCRAMRSASGTCPPLCAGWPQQVCMGGTSTVTPRCSSTRTASATAEAKKWSPRQETNSETRNVVDSKAAVRVGSRRPTRAPERQDGSRVHGCDGSGEGTLDPPLGARDPDPDDRARRADGLRRRRTLLPRSRPATGGVRSRRRNSPRRIGKRESRARAGTSTRRARPHGPPEARAVEA